MVPKLRRDVEKAQEALREFEGIRRVLGGTRDSERRQLQAELAEAEKKLKDELDNPTPREAPERGRARRAAGQERRLDAQFLPRESEFEDWPVEGPRTCMWLAKAVAARESAETEAGTVSYCIIPGLGAYNCDFYCINAQSVSLQR